MSDHLIKCDDCGMLMYPGGAEHLHHECREAPKPSPAADPQTDLEAAIEHHKKENPFTAEDFYFHEPEKNSTIRSFLAGIQHQQAKSADPQQSASSARGEAEAPLNKDAIFASSTFARPYLDGICQQTPFDVAKHSHYCGYIEGMRIGAEREREQRLQTMKDIVKLLHLTNGKEHGIRCVEDCISALEAASTDGGK